MNRTNASMTVLALIIVTTTKASPNWIETFDDGVGRFDVTAGQGETAFAHDAGAENLNATFIRRDISLNPISDLRLTDLGQTFTETDVIGFSVDWTPINASGYFAWPILGFFDESQEVASFVRMRNAPNMGDNYRLGHPDGTENRLWESEFPNWSFGTTYRIEFTLDGPSNLITFAVSEFSEGEFQFVDSIQSSFTATSWSARYVGMSNLPDDQFIDSTLVADLDNFSFVPEPSSMLLLIASVSLICSRRKQRSSR